MDVIIDITVRDKDGHILYESKNKPFQTDTEFRLTPTYSVERLDLRLRMCLPRKEGSI